MRRGSAVSYPLLVCPRTIQHAGPREREHFPGAVTVFYGFGYIADKPAIDPQPESQTHDSNS